MITQFVLLCGCILFLLCVCIVFIHSSAFSLCFIPIILMCSCRILIKITYLLTYLLTLNPNPTNPKMMGPHFTICRRRLFTAKTLENRTLINLLQLKLVIC